MLTILLVILIVLVVAGAPNWGYHSYGWGPSGIGGVLLILVVLWLLFGSGLRVR